MVELESPRHRLAWAAGVLGLCTAGAVLLLLTPPEVQPVPSPDVQPAVRVVRVEPRDFELRVRSQGTVVPRAQSELVPEISGRVIWVSPALVPGGYFAQGDPLIRLDRADYEAGLRRAAARVVRSEADHQHAERRLARQQDLETNAVLSEAQLEDAQRAERVAFAELEEARVAHEEAERDLARTELAAPYEGRVREESVDVGQYVDRGNSVATLYAIDSAEVRLPVPDAEFAHLDVDLLGRDGRGPGPGVELSASFGGRSHTWRGHIVRTEGEIDPRTRMVHVVARIDDPYGLRSDAKRPPLAVGLFVHAEIEGRTERGVFSVPRVALREDDHVWVVGDGTHLVRRKVEVLRVERDRALIRRGLARGEHVCVSDVPLFVDGMRVAPMPLETAEVP